jgi:hypothetical protein
MAKKCRGSWSVELTFDGSGKPERGEMSIGAEDAGGNFDGEHFDEGNTTSKTLRRGKCKSGKIHFERDHKDGGVIVHDGEVVSDLEMSGTFKIVPVGSLNKLEGDGSEKGDRGTEKDREIGDTGIWTGTKDGLVEEGKEKKSEKGKGGSYQSAP